MPEATRVRSLVPLPIALRVNAVIYAISGAALLAATWKSLYEELDSFRPMPWIYAQLAGAALLALAYLCAAVAKRDGEARTLVTRTVAVLNVATFACIGIWLFSDDKGIPSSGTLGSWVFDVLAVVLLVLGIIEGRAALRSARAT